MKDQSNERLLERVRRYYDLSTPLFLTHFGPTLQAGVLRATGPSYSSDDFRNHNLFVAKRAGLTDCMRVLDAGCGVAGPSLDMASNIGGLVVDGVTISRVQAEVARHRAAAANLIDRVHIHVGDYHAVPFDDGAFDTVLFLESAGHSHALVQLFSEARRVLAAGGTLYIKDLFQRDAPLSQEQSAGLDLINHVFAYRTSTMDAMCQAVEKAGFRNVNAVNLASEVSILPFVRAMADWSKPKPRLNAFGRMHYREAFRNVPIHFGEIKATK
jgi:cyclopropane fatty-acyl-phospholipid synthase-like methyltransferase